MNLFQGEAQNVDFISEEFQIFFSVIYGEVVSGTDPIQDSSSAADRKAVAMYEAAQVRFLGAELTNISDSLLDVINGWCPRCGFL